MMIVFEGVTTCENILGNYSVLEQTIRTLIEKWLIDWNKSEDNIPFNDIINTLWNSWQVVLNPFHLTEEQKNNIKKAYLSAIKNDDTHRGLVDTLNRWKEINFNNYIEILEIIREWIANWSIKLSTDNIIPFSSIFDALEVKWYEKINWFHIPEEIKEIIKEAFTSACKSINNN